MRTWNGTSKIETRNVKGEALKCVRFKVVVKYSKYYGLFLREKRRKIEKRLG